VLSGVLGLVWFQVPSALAGQGTVWCTIDRQACSYGKSTGGEVAVAER
jgi:hypothetical protein